MLVGAALVAGALTLGCGSGGDSGPRGMQCAEVLTAACDRLADPCLVIPANQVSLCISSGISSCCAGNCGASVVSTEAEIQTCIADIDAASCSSLDVTNGGTLPSSCLGVVRSAFVLGGGAFRSTSLDSNVAPGAHAGTGITAITGRPGVGIGQLISR